MTITRTLLLYIFIPFFALNAQANTSVDAIKHYLQINQPQKAYLLAIELQEKLAGDPQFDYWFGRAAFENKDYDKASFAFERVLIADPKHRSARDYLARCYQQMGDPRFATRITPNVDKKAKAAYRHFYLGLSRGWDSNINEGTDLHTFTISWDPVPPIPIDLDDLEGIRAIHNAFTRARIAGIWAGSMTHTSSWFLSGQAFHKRYDDNKHREFNTATLFLKGGLAFKHHQNDLRIPLTLESLYVDKNNYEESLRNIASLGLEYTVRHFDPQQWIFFGEGGAIRYQQNRDQDVDFFTTGLKWRYTLPKHPFYFTARGYWGMQKSKHDSEFDINHNHSFVGTGITANWNPVPTHKFYAGADLQYRRYQYDSLLEMKRRNRIRAAHVGWEWAFAKQYLFRTDYSFKSNASNLPILSFKRNILEAAVEYQLD